MVTTAMITRKEMDQEMMVRVAMLPEATSSPLVAEIQDGGVAAGPEPQIAQLESHRLLGDARGLALVLVPGGATHQPRKELLQAPDVLVPLRVLVIGLALLLVLAIDLVLPPLDGPNEGPLLRHAHIAVTRTRQGPIGVARPIEAIVENVHLEPNMAIHSMS